MEQRDDIRTDVVPSIAVVEAVSEASGTDPTRLPALYRAVDPDALDAIVDPTAKPIRYATVEFVYHGYVVTATTTDGGISVTLEEEVPECAQ